MKYLIRLKYWFFRIIGNYDFEIELDKKHFFLPGDNIHFHDQPKGKFTYIGKGKVKISK